MLSSLLFTGCSSTSALKEDEQLFAGLKPIEYTNYEENSYADSVKEEMEYALASAPTGAFMGSSYFRTPFPVRLWIWNAFSPSDDGLSRWITKVFGSKPKLMENVNPQLRAQVAEHQLNTAISMERWIMRCRPRAIRRRQRWLIRLIWAISGAWIPWFISISRSMAGNSSIPPCRRRLSEKEVLSMSRNWSRSASD